MKFTQDIVMYVTKEQYKKDLEKPLKDLGHRLSKYHLIKNGYLVTNDGKDNGILYFYIAKDTYSSSRYLIESYNPELFLALAAMNNGEDWIVGEYLYYMDEEKVFKCTLTEHANSKLGYAGNTHKDIYRKATKEEILEYFKMKNPEPGLPPKKEFPEKWCIPIESEAHVKFWNKEHGRCLPLDFRGYITSKQFEPWGGYTYPKDSIEFLKEEGYVQITYKEFKEHYFGSGGEPIPEPTPEPLPKKETAELLETLKKKKKEMSVENAILEEVTKIVTTDKKIEDKLLEKLEKLGIVPTEKVIVLKEYDKTFKKATVQHNKFETVLKCLDVRSNLALVGPAGK